jgi:serine/threonine protein kinase
MNHPNIVTVYDAGEYPAPWFLVMEAVDGRTVRTLLADVVSTAILVEYGVQMTTGQVCGAFAEGFEEADVRRARVLLGGSATFSRV